MAVDYRSVFEHWYQKLHLQFTQHDGYGQLLAAGCSREAAVRLIENICRSHLRSPQILSFLFALAPPSALDQLKGNLLEELGLHGGKASHPELLRRLAEQVGITGERWQALEVKSEQVLKSRVLEALLFPSLRDLGLNIMLEVFAFEWFLSREAAVIGRSLRRVLCLSDDTLEWFFLHSEVDIAHAEEGLRTLVAYVNYYELDEESVRNIGEITFRANVFLKRYFDRQIESGI